MNALRLLSLVGLTSLLMACGSDGSSNASDGGTGGTPAGGAGAGGVSSGGSAGMDIGGSSAGGSGGASSCTVTPPDTWSAPSFESNAAEVLGLRARLVTLTGDATMRGMETGDVAFDASAITAAFEAGSPSLADVATDGVTPIVQDAFTEFSQLVEATVGADGGTVELLDMGSFSPGAQGGVWSEDARGFNEGGIEVRQIVDKGLFAGGGLYAYALTLTAGTIDAGTIDALAAAFGANAGLNGGRSDDPIEANQNVHSANYAYSMGFYSTARQALIDAKAYAGDEACTAERDAALVTFFRTWEKSMMARFVLYANIGATGVASFTDELTLVDNLHDFSEGLGLAVSFYGVPDPDSGPLAGQGRVMTDAQLAEALTDLGYDPTKGLASATVGGWVADPLGLATAVRNSEGVVADALDLTDADLAAFRDPTQG